MKKKKAFATFALAKKLESSGWRVPFAMMVAEKKRGWDNNNPLHKRLRNQKMRSRCGLRNNLTITRPIWRTPVEVVMVFPGLHRQQGWSQ